MELTEDIIYGDMPDDEITHYIEANLLLFRDKELIKLFKVLKKFYKDCSDDLQYAENRVNKRITLVNDNLKNYTDENVNTLNERITNEVNTLTQYINETKQELQDNINENVNTLNETIKSNYEQLDTKIDDAVTQLYLHILSQVNTLNKRIDDEVNSLNETINNLNIKNQQANEALDNKINKEIEDRTSF